MVWAYIDSMSLLFSFFFFFTGCMLQQVGHSSTGDMTSTRCPQALHDNCIDVQNTHDREKEMSLGDSLGNTAVDSGNNDSGMLFLKDDDRCWFCPGLITIGPHSNISFAGRVPNIRTFTHFFSVYQLSHSFS